MKTSYAITGRKKRKEEKTEIHVWDDLCLLAADKTGSYFRSEKALAQRHVGYKHLTRGVRQRRMNKWHFFFFLLIILVGLKLFLTIICPLGNEAWKRISNVLIRYTTKKKKKQQPFVPITVYDTTDIFAHSAIDTSTPNNKSDALYFHTLNMNKFQATFLPCT